jgi:hypothetical protein
MRLFCGEIAKSNPNLSRKINLKNPGFGMITGRVMKDACNCHHQKTAFF